MKKISQDTRTKILRSSYLGAILLMVLIIVVLLFTRQTENKPVQAQGYTSIEEEWTLTPGGNDYVDISKLGGYFATGADTLSIYWKIHDIEYDQSFIFRSKDVYCKIYLDGELLFETTCYESPIYTASPGNNWNYFTLPSNHCDDALEMQVTYVYGNDAVSVDHLYYGDVNKWALDFLVSKALAVLLSIFIIFAGIVIMAVDHSAYKRSGKHSLLYLGIYAVLMGMWSLLETNTIQLFTSDGRFIQLLDNLLMVTDTLPLFFYLDEEFDIFKHMVFRFIAILDIVYIYVCLIGQFTGILDLHNHLFGSWIASGLSFAVLIWLLIMQINSFARGEKIKKSVVIQVAGFVALMVIVVICLPIYTKSDGLDRAQSIRFGMLVMILMSAAAGQLQTYELIKQGTRYEIMKGLAYNDALTGLSNRTSYLEALEKYQSNPPSKLGVVFLDVNNLKRANDNYGHEVGDRLICAAAEVIGNSFGKYGIAYRTGGDEFIVFLEGINPEQSYREGLAKFISGIEAVNKTGEFEFTFNIAHGFSHCADAKAETITSMINDADAKMYEDKKKLKEAEKSTV